MYLCVSVIHHLGLITAKHVGGSVEFCIQVGDGRRWVEYCLHCNKKPGGNFISLTELQNITIYRMLRMTAIINRRLKNTIVLSYSCQLAF